MSLAPGHGQEPEVSFPRPTGRRGTAGRLTEEEAEAWAGGSDTPGPSSLAPAAPAHPLPLSNPGNLALLASSPPSCPSWGAWGSCRAQLLTAGLPVRLRGCGCSGRPLLQDSTHTLPRPSGCGWSAAGTAQVHWAPVSLRAQMGPESSGSGGGRTCPNTPTPPLLNLGFWGSPPQVSWH